MKLSIITINYNNYIGLKKTIESVIEQTFTDFEFIIIDGGSIDGSVDIIKRSLNKINYWVSEQDKGIYNAMNKGLAQAKGEYVLMLNSGDYLANNGILSSVFKNAISDDIIYGDVTWDDKNNQFVTQFPDTITFNYFRVNSLSHQSTFIRKSLHGISGLYDENYKIISDWKFFLLSICKYNCSYKHLSMPVSVCPRNGISCDEKNSELINFEKESVFKEHFSAYLSDYYDFDNTYKKLTMLQEENTFQKKRLIIKIIKKAKHTYLNIKTKFKIKTI